MLRKLEDKEPPCRKIPNIRYVPKNWGWQMIPTYSLSLSEILNP
jgi:hypothetical protein